MWNESEDDYIILLINIMLIISSNDYTNISETFDFKYLVEYGESEHDSF